MPPGKFKGAGIYAIYYVGPFEQYGPIAELNKDGKFECAFGKEKSKWRMAVGTYTISPDGTIKATARHGGVKLGVRCTLKDGVIYRPRGPKLRVPYKKVKVP